MPSNVLILDSNKMVPAGKVPSLTSGKISDLTEAIEDAVAALFTRSTHTGASFTYTDNGSGLGTLALTITGGGSGVTDPEVVRDTMNAAFRQGAGISIVADDPGDTVTISISGLAISQVTNLQAALDAKAPVKSAASVTSGSTPTPTGDAPSNELFITTLAVGATIGAPSGTPTNGNRLLLRIRDDGTSRTLAWNAIYRAMGSVVLPANTPAGKTTYVAAVYNSTDSRWDVTSTVVG